MSFSKTMLIFIFLIINYTTYSQNITISYCGLINPAVEKDCYAYDTTSNSCCYYSYAGSGSCVWLGTRYKGTANYGDLYVSCGVSYIYHRYLIVVFLFLILLIF